jgi:hypothetical protein
MTMAKNTRKDPCPSGESPEPSSREKLERLRAARARLDSAGDPIGALPPEARSRPAPTPGGAASQAAGRTGSVYGGRWEWRESATPPGPEPPGSAAGPRPDPTDDGYASYVRNVSGHADAAVEGLDSRWREFERSFELRVRAGIYHLSWRYETFCRRLDTTIRREGTRAERAAAMMQFLAAHRDDLYSLAFCALDLQESARETCDKGKGLLGI